ncbi:MAG: hypothetical protein MJB14_18330 [Spirochaetes bacterium]|nr:hypothetical protein [Spirochaetota bacterium]
MNKKSIIIFLISIASGSLLFFGIRFLLQQFGTTPLIRVSIEEGAKYIFIVVSIIILNLLFPDQSQGWYALPFFIICFFGVIENIFYFFEFPDTSIFIRLTYAYFVHLNTGLLYLLVIASQRNMILWFLSLIPAIGYHYGYNSVQTDKIAVYILLSLVNILIFMILYFQIKTKIYIRRELNG